MRLYLVSETGLKSLCTGDFISESWERYDWKLLGNWVNLGHGGDLEKSWEI